MQKQAKVINIIENQKQWQGNNGMIYYHEITFDNGDKGQYGSKTPTCEKFKVGDVADYDIEERVNGNFKNYTVKPVQQNGAGGFKPKQDNIISITAQSSMKSSVEFHKNNPNAGHAELKETAEFIFDWLMSKTSK